MDSFYFRSCCYSFIFGPSLGYRPKLVSSEKEQALTIQHTAEPLNDGEATVKQKIRRMDLMEMRRGIFQESCLEVSGISMVF